MYMLKIQVLMVLLCGMPYSLHGMLKENEDNKQCIEQKLQILRNCTSVTIPQQVFWNNDFSKCAWITIIEDPFALMKKRLELTLMGLDKNKELNFKVGGWEGYQHPIIDDQVRPFFDKEGGVFCYGYGRFDRNFLPGVLEYSLNADGEMNRKKYWLDNQICCSKFLDFPVLLQVILRSTKVRERVREEVIDKVCEIEGVTIPEDYKTLHHSPGEYISYNELNDSIKKIIDGRYLAQQQEKNNQNLQEK